MRRRVDDGRVKQIGREYTFCGQTRSVTPRKREAAPRRQPDVRSISEGATSEGRRDGRAAEDPGLFYSSSRCSSIFAASLKGGRRITAYGLDRDHTTHYGDRGLQPPQAMSRRRMRIAPAPIPVAAHRASIATPPMGSSSRPPGRRSPRSLRSTAGTCRSSARAR